MRPNAPITTATSGALAAAVPSLPRTPHVRPGPHRSRRTLGGKEATLQLDLGELEERLEIHGIGTVVPHELVERRRIAPTVLLPEANRVETAHALDPRAVADPQPLLDPLEAARVAEAVEHEAEVDVDRRGRELRKAGLEERDVEPAPVERHQEGKARR